MLLMVSTTNVILEEFVTTERGRVSGVSARLGRPTRPPDPAAWPGRSTQPSNPAARPGSPLKLPVTAAACGWHFCLHELTLGTTRSWPKRQVLTPCANVQVQSGREISGPINRWPIGREERRTDGRTDERTDRRTNGPSDRPTDRPTERPIDRTTDQRAERTN